MATGHTNSKSTLRKDYLQWLSVYMYYLLTVYLEWACSCCHASALGAISHFATGKASNSLINTTYTINHPCDKSGNLTLLLNFPKEYQHGSDLYFICSNCTDCGHCGAIFTHTEIKFCGDCKACGVKQGDRLNCTANQGLQDSDCRKGCVHDNLTDNCAENQPDVTSPNTPGNFQSQDMDFTSANLSANRYVDISPRTHWQEILISTMFSVVALAILLALIIWRTNISRQTTTNEELHETGFSKMDEGTKIIAKKSYGSDDGGYDNCPTNSHCQDTVESLEMTIKNE
ncbi:uncharacterized protein LOC106150766 [Lingula anatina]|uniref:Uncharacterized protein LOC106150766 n=1 Tax=Lingula anatina TaxID=7574 RepID=A0A1S3GZU9_LINAN|nr:uncharacterized protein LOC106150766 [Lingula anatina]|eukprot:XP_013379202.2 uncharacterized protein LOC106150766 [Lingula anatina]